MSPDFYADRAVPGPAFGRSRRKRRLCPQEVSGNDFFTDVKKLNDKTLCDSDRSRAHRRFADVRPTVRADANIAAAHHRH